MGNYQYHNYEYQRDSQNDKKPINTHLIIYTATNTWYMVDASNRKVLLKTVNAGVSYSTVTTRTYDIRGMWHDDANDLIYIVDNEWDNSTPGTMYQRMWKLDYGSSDAITEMGGWDESTSTNVWGENTDIFIIGSTIYTLHMYNTASHRIGVYYFVSGTTWTLDCYFDCSGIVGARLNYITIVGTDAWFLGDDYQYVHSGMSLMKYNSTANTLTQELKDTNLNQPLPQRCGMIYDEVDNLYYMIEDSGDSKHYMIQYNISGDTATQLGLYNIILMLERNVNSSNDPPFNLQKGFDASDRKIYQISNSKNNFLQYISSLDEIVADGSIIAIISSFLFLERSDTTVEIYEYVDQIDNITRFEITHDKEDFPKAKGTLRRDKITLSKNLFMQFTGKYSADQTTLNNQVVFEGKVQNKDGKKHQTFDCLGLGVEMTTVQPSGTISETTNDIIKAINAGSNSITNTPTYITDGTLSVGQSIVNNVMEGDKPYKSIVNHFKDIDKFTWVLRPQGKIDYNDGTIDSGVDLRYNGNSFVNNIWNINTFDLPTGVNRVEVKGAINTSTGVPYDGDWDDEELQQAENIKLFTISDASLDSNSLCNITAQSIGERESTDTTTVVFNVRDTSVGFPQPSQVIDFEYLSEDVNIPLDQLIIDRVVLDVKKDVLFIEASTGLVFEYKRDSPLENLVEENSQLILQNARFAQGLQSDANNFLTQTNINNMATQTDLNAKISDTVYSQTDWNAVTTIGASKNALSDKFELMQSEINILLTQSDLNGYATQTDLNAKVSDVAYNQSTWNAVATIAPSKNAVRDKFESLSSFNPPIGYIAMYSGTWADNSTIPGWYKCDGSNSTVNMVDKFVRGATTSGATGGSDDAVVVTHDHPVYINTHTGTNPKGAVNAGWIADKDGFTASDDAGVSGTSKNIPAYYALIFIQRIT